MPFNLPTFNLSANVWTGTNLPSGGPFDVGGVACQLYVNTRGLLDITPAAWDTWVPPVWIRVPIADFDVSYSIWEIPAGTTRYYRVRWRQRVHEGFPNEYGAYLAEQCLDDGTPVLPELP